MCWECRDWNQGQLKCLHSAEQGTRTEGTAEGEATVGVPYVAEGWATHTHVELSKANQLCRVEALED